MKMNLKASLRFQLADLFKSSIVFFATIVVIAVCVPLIRLAVAGRGEVSFSGFGIIASIYLFVVGIVAPRSYVRLDNQFGRSRVTSFVTLIAAALIVSVALSAAGSLLTVLAQLIYPAGDELFLADLYQLMYNDCQPLTFAQHLISIGFDVCICLCGYIFGMFFTLLFWRLNKLWTVVAALGIVVFFNLLVNIAAVGDGSTWLSGVLHSFAEAVARGPGALIIFFLAVAAILAVIEWLLLRRAYIRASV